MYTETLKEVLMPFNSKELEHFNEATKDCSPERKLSVAKRIAQEKLPDGWQFTEAANSSTWDAVSKSTTGQTTSAIPIPSSRKSRNVNSKLIAQAASARLKHAVRQVLPPRMSSKNPIPVPHTRLPMIEGSRKSRNVNSKRIAQAASLRLKHVRQQGCKRLKPNRKAPVDG